MGICYSKLAKHAEAFTEYDAVLRINPQDGVGYCNRGRKHLALGRFSEAEADALMSLKLNPKHKTSQQLLVDARKKLLDSEPPSSEAELYKTAEKLRKHKQWSAAIDAFSELLETNYPGKAHLLNQRGVCFQELGQHEEALKDLTESLELDPTQPISKLCNRESCHSPRSEYRVPLKLLGLITSDCVLNHRSPRSEYRVPLKLLGLITSGCVCSIRRRCLPRPGAVQRGGRRPKPGDRSGPGRRSRQGPALRSSDRHGRAVGRSPGLQRRPEALQRGQVGRGLARHLQRDRERAGQGRHIHRVRHPRLVLPTARPG